MMIRIVTIAIALVVLGLPAHGRSAGITGQYQNGCGGGTCHGGAANNNTVLTLTGPTTVKAGSTNNYTFRVAHNAQDAAGLNIAFLAPAAGPAGTFTAGAGAQVNGSQITHTAEKAFDNNNGADFTFSWTAPEAHGIYTFAGAGNAVDGNGNAGGDIWNTMNQQIIVTGATVTAPTGGSYCQGSEITIKWTHTGITTLRIEMSSDNFQNVTVVGTTVNANDGQLAYTIPTGQQPATTYQIRLVDTRSGDELDRSNGFAIAGSPNILTQPEDTDVCTGRTLQLTVGATGSQPTYQWRKDGQNIAGATTGIFRIVSVDADDAGSYDCVITSCNQTVTSDPAVVTIKVPPTIVEQPKGAEVCDGERVELSVDATGSDLTYQWLRNGVPIPGADARTYTIAGISAATEGIYQCRITGSCTPQRTTDSAVVDMIAAPAITEQPQGADLTAGDNLTLKVEASGDALEYQWYKDGAPIDGATGAEFSISSVVRADSGTYSVRVRNRCDSVESARAVVSVRPAQGPGRFVLGVEAVRLGEIAMCAVTDTVVAALLKNEGGSPVTVTGATVDPAGAVEIVDLVFPVEIAAGSSLPVQLRVSAPGDGSFSASIEFAEASGNKTLPVTSTGIAVAGGSPDSLVFPEATFGQTRCVTTFGVACPSYEITTITIEGPGAADFAVATTLPMILEEGQTADLCIVTTQAGSANAEMVVSTTAGTFRVALRREVGTSVDESDPTVISGLTVAPNPARDEVRITSPNGAMMTARIHNMMGGAVRSLSGAGEILWDGRDLSGSRVAPGMYVLVIEQGLRTQVIKLLVE